jgi:hypothetical protein
MPPAQCLIFYREANSPTPSPGPNRIDSKSASEPCMRQSESKSKWSIAGTLFPFKVLGFPTMMVWL